MISSAILVRASRRSVLLKWARDWVVRCGWTAWTANAVLPMPPIPVVAAVGDHIRLPVLPAQHADSASGSAPRPLKSGTWAVAAVGDRPLDGGYLSAESGLRG